MKRALRRHQSKVAKIRRFNILRQGGSYWWLDKWWKWTRDWMTEPNWWTHENCIVPMRVEEARLCKKALKGFDTEGMQWPEGKKPHVYYW